ncbi:hypothetical protein ACH4SP_28280 [Streptomyces sp. NPDC021093]|uniref:hypothetical protein n=1 Tax=Streptomyces sp. NPDC021093 TaxID=3365112 RepID=UPI0037937013
MTAEEPVRGPDNASPVPPPPLGSRILLGGPVSVPVDAKVVAHDVELQAFVEGEAARAVYHLLHLSITCEQEDDAPELHRVDVDLTLSVEEAAAVAFQPVAWSMTPRRLTADVESTTSAQLGPQMAFVGHSRTTRQSTVLLEALRELRSDPGWEIRRTRATKIGGTYRLAMVVRAPRGVTSRVTVAVGAVVRKGKMLRRYREEVPGQVGLATTL